MQFISYAFYHILQAFFALFPEPNLPETFSSAADEKSMKQTEAIIQSMTKQERRKPAIINSCRRARIAKGAGVELKDVNALLKQFSHMQKMMKSFKGKNGMKNMQALAAQFGLKM